jgi:hypothetical protein
VKTKGKNIMATQEDITAEVGLRFGQAVSTLIRGAVEEMVTRGCERQKASSALRDALQFLVERGPMPYGPKAEEVLSPPESPQ